MAMVAKHLINGADPWLAMQNQARAVVEDDDETSKEDQLRMKYSQEAFVTLGRVLNQNIMRSVLVVCGRSRYLHGECMRDFQSKIAAQRQLLVWSSHVAWAESMLKPVIEESLFSPDNLSYIGLNYSVDFFDAPLQGRPPEVEDDQILLFCHVRLAMSHVRQLLLFGSFYQAPPLAWIRLLHEACGERTLALEFFRRAHEVVLKVRFSRNPALKRYWRLMEFLRWPTVAEVFELLSHAQWSDDLNAPGYKYFEACMEYVHSMFDGILNSFSRELFFNDARDNASRGARYQQRCPARLMSIGIASAHRRLPDVPQINIKERRGQYMCACSLCKCFCVCRHLVW